MATDILQEQLVNEAFSRQSASFDDIYENNAITLLMRQKTRNEVLKYINSDDHILELNCGTGIDSLFFAKKGYKVLATDNAEGMLQKLSDKIRDQNLQDKISVQKCSFNDLEQLKGKQFGYVFSNFGGLNCTNALDKVLRDADALLLPGGHLTFVIMPKVCPWEMLMLLRGRTKTALRRFKKNGTSAHIEGVYFKCYYHSASFVIKQLKGYELCSLKGLGSLMPPPFMDHFPVKYPKLYTALCKLEDKVCNTFPFNRWCDQYVITMRKPK
jgi:ubiquinone/menaquinone biosynthesis C-methylase UbiE